MQECRSLVPRFACAGHVFGAVLRVPCEAIAKRMDLDWHFELPHERCLAGRNSAFDKLHDRDLETLAQRAKSQAQSSRRLAFARAGMDDEQALLIYRLGFALFERFLAADRFLLVRVFVG